MLPNPSTYAVPSNDRQTKRAALASAVGSTFEWYDFFIYGMLAGLVFPRLFFPELSGAMGTLVSLSTFTVGFIGRPLGAVLFGHFGDVIGRKKTLVVALACMGVPTFLIGVIPTYATAGVWAPLLLVLLRFAQGVALGGEWGGATLFTVEHAPEGRKGFFGSLPQMGIPGGQIVATLVLLAVTMSLSDAELLAWGWRIPFLLGAVLLIVGLVVRISIGESPEFVEAQATGSAPRAPVLEVLRSNKRSVLLVAGMHLAMSSAFYIGIVMVVPYARDGLGMESTTVLGGVFAAQLVAVCLLPLAGAMTDRIGQRRMYFIGTLAVGAMAFPFFALIQTGVGFIVWLGLILGAVAWVPMMASQPSFFAKLFGAGVRYSGVAIGYQLGTILGSATPVLGTILLEVGGGTPWLVAGFLVLVSGVSFIAAYLAKDQPESDPGERRAVTDRAQQFDRGA